MRCGSTTLKPAEAGELVTEGASAPEGEPDVGRLVEIGQKYGLKTPPPEQ
jgi:hypothetical protein